MEIKKIDSVTLPVSDHRRSADWYAHTLGLEEIWRMDDRKGVGFGVGDNSATLNLFQEPGPARVIIQVERVDAARRELEGKGVRFEGPTETVPGIGRFAGFKDPDGNRIWLLDYTIEHGEAE
jgi:catechol 2,3-dioxygenase-like lactoylglutathione lyase family enzyme